MQIKKFRSMKWHYLVHLVGWTGPLMLLQWAIGWRIFRRNLPAVFVPAVMGTLFFGCCDSIAIRSGVWRFDPQQVLGWWIGVLPLEEVLFFLLTILLVTQSLILLLPARYRWP